MDTFARVTPATRTRRALLNDTIRGLAGLHGGRGVTQGAFDPLSVQTLRAAGLRPRTLMHPLLPGFKK